MPFKFNPITGTLDVVAANPAATPTFKTMQTPAGTSPVALTSTDILTFVSGDNSVTITGNSSTDTIDFRAAGGGGTVTTVSVVSANGLAGTVATATTTPAITLSTTVTGILKGNGTAISAATAGADYSAGTSALATGILKSTTTTGALSIAVAGDFPTLNQNTTGLAGTATSPATGSAHGAVTLDSSGHFQSIAPGTAGNYVRSNGTDYVQSTIQVADVPTLNQNTSGTAANITASSNTSLTSLANLATVGTITSGTWTGTTIAIANGGTGQTSATAAFDALSPMSALGDTIYGGASGTRTLLAGQTTLAKKFLCQTGAAGPVSAAPTWDYTKSVNATAKVANYPLVLGDSVILVDPSGGAFTVTMPDPTACAGQEFVLICKATGTGTNLCTIAAHAAETFGAAAFSALHMSTVGETWKLISDGTNWQIIVHYANVAATTYNGTIGAVTTAPTLGTSSVNSWYWSREGQHMLIRFDYLQTAVGSGANGSGTYKFPLPLSFAVNTTVTQTYTGAAVGPSACGGGSWMIGPGTGSGGFTANAIVNVFDSANLALVPLSQWNTGNNTLTNEFGHFGSSNALFTTNAAASISFWARIPITNWEP